MFIQYMFTLVKDLYGLRATKFVHMHLQSEIVLTILNTKFSKTHLPTRSDRNFTIQLILTRFYNTHVTITAV